MSEIGYTWIARHTGVSPVQPFAVVSQINGRRATTQDGDLRTEVYPERYRPQNLLIDHLVFALRYEGIHLEFLARLFAKVSVREQLEHWINAEPSGTYARRLGFLCEWLTGQPLAITQAIQGNYIDLLDPTLYVTGAAVKVSRWKVRDNLPGTPDYCPLIRRVDRIIATEQYDIRERLDCLQADFGLDLLLRNDDALPAWKYPDLTAHSVYLAQVIDSTLTHEMRAEAQFLQSNEKARTSIKAFLEAPDNELDRIIHAVRENGNVLSGKLRKKYPLLDQRPELAERLVAAVRTAFEAIE